MPALLKKFAKLRWSVEKDVGACDAAGVEAESLSLGPDFCQKSTSA